MTSLLAGDEPRPWALERADGVSDFFLICDHAGARIPRGLGSLGLASGDLRRHIALDIGIAEVAHHLSAELGATLVLQPYSRLVIDCNRPLHRPDSIARISERTVIPGNAAVTPDQAAQRAREIFAPYHACIREQLDARLRRGQRTLLLALHSFTPVYLGESRPWHAGMLYHRDPRLAQALGAALRTDPALIVGDNQPYSVDDDTDYSIPEYGERRGLPHVEIEIRQDLIGDDAGQRQWASRLARALHPLALGL